MAALNKRKRDTQDVAGGRPAPAMNQMSDEFEQHYLQTDDIANTDSNLDFEVSTTDNANQQSSEHMQVQGGSEHTTTNTAAAAMAQYHTMTVPQSTEQSFLAQTSGDAKDMPSDQSGSGAPLRASMFGDFNITDMRSSPNGGPSLSSEHPTASLFPPKPAVGTEEWHKVRKDNHKEVERRRRETINEGINELAKIVPGCEKNKGSILQRAVQFITQLKDNETQNIEKWTLEKLLTEQAIAELSSSCDKLKEECQRAWTECEQWKKAAQKAGISIDNEDKADADGEDAD